MDEPGSRPTDHRDPVTVPVAALRSRMAVNLGRVRFAGARLVLTTHGTPVAAVVSLDDLELLHQVDVVGIPAPVVEVAVVLPLGGAGLWQLLVQSRHRAPWWPIDSLDACPGERVRQRWLTSDDRVVELRGEVVSVERGRSIAFTWTEAGCDRDTSVRLQVVPTAVGGRTELRIGETGFGPLELERAREHHDQWAELLVGLAEHVASSTG